MLENTIRSFWENSFQNIVLPQNIVPLLPDSSVKFLTQVGLPIDNRIRDVANLHLHPFPEQFKLIKFWEGTYVPLYQNNPTLTLSNLLAIESISGKVFMLHRLTPENQTAIPHRYYANRNILEFLGCLSIHLEGAMRADDECDKVKNLYGKVDEISLRNRRIEAQKLFKAIGTEMRDRLKEIDPDVLSNDNYYWSHLVEGVERCVV